jgi:hypothetical protein
MNHGPICVTGMHRSGTSMVAEILRTSGVYLGEDDELLPSSRFNPRGYFENRAFVALNDEILAALGGAWDRPPRIRFPWARGRLEPLRTRACALANAMQARAPWGWKDPRTSLTLRFWQAIVPDLRLVVCVREPTSVAESLSARDGCSQEFGISLWTEYNRRLLPFARRATAVVSYERCLSDPVRAVDRLLQQLRLPSSSAAAAAVDPALRLHRSVSGVLPRDAARLHRRLSQLAD